MRLRLRSSMLLTYMLDTIITQSPVYIQVVTPYEESYCNEQIHKFFHIDNFIRFLELITSWLAVWDEVGTFLKEV